MRRVGEALSGEPQTLERPLLLSTEKGRRVLIMSVSAGAGHVKAAAALEKTFLRDQRVLDVVNNDALQYT
ncbi:MAG: hypothetical protein EBS79_12875, partial [Gammaproteobacteria bacterium]|nr:hypothetical protein [Gammaproteobacteria bacterium]